MSDATCPIWPRLIYAISFLSGATLVTTYFVTVVQGGAIYNWWNTAWRASPDGPVSAASALPASAGAPPNPCGCALAERARRYRSVRKKVL